MNKLALKNLVVLAFGVGLIGGCGSSETKNDAARRDTGADAPRDTIADTAADAPPVDAPRDVAPDTARDGAADAPRDVGAGDVVGDGPRGDVAADGPAADGPAADGPAADTGPDGPVLTPRQLRGQYLVTNVVGCQDCHTPRDATGMFIQSQFMSGAECFVRLPNNHCLHTRNLTSDATGLLNRTDAEIKQMFLDGIRPAATGDVALNPVMPYYVFHNMRPEDADDIVAYLRTIPAVVHAVPPRDVEFDVAVHANYLDPTTFPLPADTFAERDSALRGRYLTTSIGACVECHTQHNPPPAGNLNPLDTTRYFMGGEQFFGFPATIVSKNLTSDPTTGLGNWSPADVVKVLKMGIDRDGKGVCPPMPTGPFGAYGGLTDPDATDIANYVKSLPPRVNMVVDMCTFPFPPPPDGGAASNDAQSDATDARD
jgi:hypothetical protein